MHRQLEELEREFAAATERLKRLAADGTEEAWHARPPEGGWSAAECVAHLNLTTQAYLPGIDRALNDARALGGTAAARMRRDPIGWLLWKMTGPGGRMKAKTSPDFVPNGRLSRESLVGEFERLQGELVARLRAADGLPIERVRMPSVFNARLRYSLYSTFSILAGHEHRHLGQAEGALAATGAPTGETRPRSRK